MVKQAGLSLIELLVGLAISGVVLVIAATQFQNITGLLFSIQAESATKEDLALIGDQFRSYFQSKRKGGAFECTATPTVGVHAYCVLRSSCESTSGTGYTRCRSLALLRGDPLDASTNPDRITISTSCVTATGAVAKGVTFDGTVCGTGCAKGELPVLTFERTKADGKKVTIRYPSVGVSTGTQKKKLRNTELRGAELCLSKADGSATVTVDLQAYFERFGTMKSISRQIGLSEVTSANANIEFLP